MLWDVYAMRYALINLNEKKLNDIVGYALLFYAMRFKQTHIHT